ncbi:MAG: hypothetical protein IKR42_06490 [Campylobacter sp.]|nr:hypothetical protein [Campylobacter sp.]
MNSNAETIRQTGDFFLSMNDWGVTPILFFSVFIILAFIGVGFYFYIKYFSQMLKALENLNHTIELSNKTTEALLSDLKYKAERSIELHEKTHRKLDMLIMKERGI